MIRSIILWAIAAYGTCSLVIIRRVRLAGLDALAQARVALDAAQAQRDDALWLLARVVELRAVVSDYYDAILHGDTTKASTLYDRAVLLAGELDLGPTKEH